ncbi:MAG: FtsW/RodA/SpoVE family cell cycle protein [Oscillospiraceae bacterium]|nr:FtsW/RodA/SpoVE family cell cycle protein [Oscillospiraceae bacterium]
MKRVGKLAGSYLRMGDTLLLFLCLAASVFGLVLIYSATRSYETGRYMLVQGLALGLGLVLFIVFSLIDTDVLTERWYLLVAFNLALLAALRIFGVEGETGNRSWIRFAGIGIQPSELLKITFILLLSRQISRLQESRKGLSGVFSVMTLALHFLFLFGVYVVISADAGNALVFLFIFAAMCFAGGLNVIWFLVALALAALATPLLWTRFLSEYQRNRILAPYFPDLVDPTGLDITWQPRQSRIALASGGLTGQGYLNGERAQGELLPFKHTDFIFSVAGEELGLICCVAIMLLLTAIILRVLFTGLRSGSHRDMLICAGFAGMLTFQAFENIGMCLMVTPVVGITLPFFSYGGSSLVTCFAAMGIVSGVRLRQKGREDSQRI